MKRARLTTRRYCFLCGARCGNKRARMRYGNPVPVHVKCVRALANPAYEWRVLK